MHQEFLQDLSTLPNVEQTDDLVVHKQYLCQAKKKKERKIWKEG